MAFFHSNGNGGLNEPILFKHSLRDCKKSLKICVLEITVLITGQKYKKGKKHYVYKKRQK